MNQRSVVWVALFGGVSLMLLGWLLLSNTDPTTEAAMDRAAKGEGGAEPGDFATKTADRREPLLRREIDPTLIRSAKRGDQLALRGPALARLRAIHGKGPLVGKRGPAGTYPLDSEGVASAVAALQSDLNGCFKAAKFHTPDLDGDLVLTLTAESVAAVEPAEGAPADPEPSNTVPTAKIKSVGTDVEQDAAVLEGCLTTVFADVTFTGMAPDAADTTIRYPVRLSADP